MITKILRQIKHFLIEFIAQYFILPCKETTRLISESKDRKLRFRERFRIKSHLQFCQWCTDYGHQIDLVEDALKLKTKSPELGLDPDLKLSESAKEKIKNSLSGESDE